MEKVDLIVFDFDGTLVNTGDDIAAAVNHTLGVLDIPILKKETVIKFVGDGARKLVERVLGNENHGRLREALEILQTYYAEHLLDTTGLYPGARGVLEYYKDIKKAIVTNKPYSFTLDISKALKIENYFDDIIGIDSGTYGKPDPRLVAALLDKYHISKEKVVVVGDGVNDVMLAKNSGVTSCALLNGYTNREILLRLEPDYTCESIAELKKIFA
jgi:phosphoglycolate phosphatase